MRFSKYSNVHSYKHVNLAGFAFDWFEHLTSKGVLCFSANRPPVRRVDLTKDASNRPVQIVSIRSHLLPPINANCVLFSSADRLPVRRIDFKNSYSFCSFMKCVLIFKWLFSGHNTYTDILHSTVKYVRSWLSLHWQGRINLKVLGIYDLHTKLYGLALSRNNFRKLETQSFVRFQRYLFRFQKLIPSPKVTKLDWYQEISIPDSSYFLRLIQCRLFVC